MQEWTIIDKDEHRVVSDSEWGDVDVQDGGDRIYDVDGTPVAACQMVGIAISCGLGPCSDGETYIIDATWVKDASGMGIRTECLKETF